MSGAESIAAHRDAVAALGAELSPDMIAATIALSTSRLDASLGDGAAVTSDISYGPHERHVLDVYTAEGLSDAPVVVFVHGGGFVAGAKSAPGSPYFANIGGWAVQHGIVAVVINYRLAPEASWPNGAEDIGAAVTWVVDHIADHGGDPAKIVLVGQSAGAMHVADYVVQPSTHGRHGRALAAAAIVSCLYDVGRAADKPIHRAYWGDDLGRWKDFDTLVPLIDSDLPLLLGVAEFDEPQFQEQAARFVAEWSARRGGYAPMHRLYGQNHLTTVYAVGSDTDALGPLLERFVAAHTRSLG